MSISSPGTLFGLSRALERSEVNSWISKLTDVWVKQMGRPPASLETDLADLERFFSPTITGRRLRKALLRLPAMTSRDSAALPREILVSSSSGRQLVTPEGRIVLHILELHRGEASVGVCTEEVAWANLQAASLYRKWGRTRLFEAMGIIEGTLRLPVIAFNLLLLVNQSVGKGRALEIPSSEPAERELSKAIGPVIDAFVGQLPAGRSRKETFRLRGGWVLTESSRHLFELVQHSGSAIWIRAGCENPLIERLGRELARRSSRKATEVGGAFDALVTAYAILRPVLAARGGAHERSPTTRAIRNKLVEAFKDAAEGEG